MGIPTMGDRAMQVLQLLALEPIVGNNGGQDIVRIPKIQKSRRCKRIRFQCTQQERFTQWILGDIKSCFDKICCQWMPENIPTDKRILKAFMKCGYIMIQVVISADNVEKIFALKY